jgi:thioredoxin 1
MNSDILLRLISAGALIAIGLLAFRIFQAYSLSRARSQSGGARLGLETVPPGQPVLVYFTTPTCAPCKTIQRPAIQRLQAQLGEKLQVVEIDASTHPDVAAAWGILSVPTTFILNSSGAPVHVNHGVAPADKLLRQLADVVK